LFTPLFNDSRKSEHGLVEKRPEKVAIRQKKTTKSRLTGKKFSGHKYLHEQL
jgi:hypothetical protein